MMRMAALVVGAVVLVGCSVSVGTSGSGEEDTDEGGATARPLPMEQMIYAESVVQQIYANGMASVTDRLHDAAVADFTPDLLEQMQGFVLDSARPSEVHYASHLTGTVEGMVVTSVDFVVPAGEGAHNAVKVSITAEPECCTVVGLEVFATKTGSFSAKLGGGDDE